MSHTPTPWIAGKYGELRSPDGRQVEVYGLQIAQVMSSPTEEDRANAALIVKAVNAHDDLVEALKRVTEHLQTMIEYHPEENTSDIDAAIYCAHGALRGEL